MRYFSFNYSSLDRFRQAILGSYMVNAGWMDEGLDTGPIALRREVQLRPDDTAHTLYLRILECEKRLLDEAIPCLLDNSLVATTQDSGGTYHGKQDLYRVSCLNLEEKRTIRETLILLRALTTNDLSESAWFRESGEVYRLQLRVTKEGSSD